MKWIMKPKIPDLFRSRHRGICTATMQENGCVSINHWASSWAFSVLKRGTCLSHWDSPSTISKKNTFEGRSAKPGRICPSKAGHHLGQLHLIIFDPDLGFMSRNWPPVVPQMVQGSESLTRWAVPMHVHYDYLLFGIDIHYGWYTCRLGVTHSLAQLLWSIQLGATSGPIFHQGTSIRKIKRKARKWKLCSPKKCHPRLHRGSERFQHYCWRFHQRDNKE